MPDAEDIFALPEKVIQTRATIFQALGKVLHAKRHV